MRTADLTKGAKNFQRDVLVVAQKRGEEALEMAQEKGHEAWKRAEKLIKKYPGSAVGAAFVLGIVLRSLFSRRED